MPAPPGTGIRENLLAISGTVCHFLFEVIRMVSRRPHRFPTWGRSPDVFGTRDIGQRREGFASSGQVTCFNPARAPGQFQILEASVANGPSSGLPTLTDVALLGRRCRQQPPDSVTSSDETETSVWTRRHKTSSKPQAFAAAFLDNKIRNDAAVIRASWPIGVKDSGYDPHIHL